MTWVDDYIYAAGGGHIAANWGAFADQTGVTAVLHLRPGAPEPFVGPPPRRFLWLAVEDEAQLDMQCMYLAGVFLADCVAQGRRVLLHSSLGRHRARWAYVAYLMVGGKGWPAARRRAEAKPWLSPYRTDPARWQAFEKWLRGGQRASAHWGAEVGSH